MVGTLSKQVIKGEMLSTPEVGKVFMIIEGKNHVRTSTVKKIISKTSDTIVFETVNSIYTLKLD